MSVNNLKTQQRFKTQQTSSTATNPLHAGLQEYKSLQKLNSTKIIIDRIMFAALGAVAIWAFYSALMSLML